MRRTLGTALALAVLLAAAACAAPHPVREHSAESTGDPGTATNLTQGRALTSEHRYDQAIDEYVAAAGDASASSEAVDGAVSALEAKTSGERLPKKLDAALALQKRLPAAAARDSLKRSAEAFLVQPVIKQAKQAEVLMKDRRAFVERMREDGEADVLPTPANERAITEAEVVDAQGHIEELGMNRDITKLYDYERDLAAAMDRFLADDQRYLREEEMSESALDELAESSDVLAEALWPVQRQLDRVRPGWR